MLLSTIVKNRSLLTQLSAFAISETRTQRTTSLNQQILQTKSWRQFLSLFTQKKEEFTPDTFHFSSRYINHLILSQRENIKYFELLQIIKVIEQFDPSTLLQNHVITFLALLRNFNRKGFETNSFYKFKNQLCSRYVELLAAKPEGKENFSGLIYAYYEIVYFNWLPGMKLISERMLNRLSQEGYSSNFLTLAQQQFLLSALVNNSDLSNLQHKIRQIILRDLSEKIDSIATNDVAKIMIALAKTNFQDGNRRECASVKKIGNKMLENISELEEKSIFQFLKTPNKNQQPIFRSIYEELLRNTFEEISEDGATNFDKKTILKLLSHLSARCNFNKLGQIQKNKFHNMLNKCFQEVTSENDTQLMRLLSNFIEEIVQNNFYKQSKIQQLVSAVQKLKSPIRLKFLQALFKIKVDISNLITIFLAQHFSENSSLATVMKYSTFFRRLITIQRYNDYKQTLENQLPLFTKKLDETFSSSQKFTDLMGYVLKNPSFEVKLQQFQTYHEEYFQRLPNPFKTDVQTTPNYYKVIYLQYVLYSFRSNDFYKFISENISNIGNPIITKVIYASINQEDNVNRNLLNLISRNIKTAIEQKEKDFIFSTLQLLNKYSSYVVKNVRGELQITKNILRILSIFFEKSQILNQLNQIKAFSNTFNKYLIKNSGNYKNESFFRDLVKLGLRNLKKMPIYKTNEVLREGLRLNLVQKRDIENIQIQKLNNFNYLQKQSLLYIKDPSHKPVFKGLASSSLNTIFFNHNLQDFIESKQTQINEILEKSHIHDFLGYLTVFNQPRSKLSSRIVTKIVRLVISSQNYVYRGDIQGAMQNLTDQGWINNKLLRQFAQNIVKNLSDKINQFSLDTHFEALRFIVSIPTYNPQEYYKKLTDYASKNFRDIEYQDVLYRLAYTNYAFKPEQLKYVQSLLKRNTYRGIYLFLATENQHSEAERKSIVAQIVEKLKNSKGSDYLIHQIQYKYLKDAYPQETTDLQLKPEQLQHAAMLVKPAKKTLNLLQQIAKVNQVTLEVLSDFKQNYIAKIKNVCMIFLNGRRTGSYHEHQFLRRALALHFKQQNYHFVFCGPASAFRIAEFIQSEAPQIITPEVKKAINEMFEINKADQFEEVQSSKKHQNKQNRQRNPRQTKHDQ